MQTDDSSSKHLPPIPPGKHVVTVINVEKQDNKLILTLKDSLGNTYISIHEDKPMLLGIYTRMQTTEEKLRITVPGVRHGG